MSFQPIVVTLQQAEAELHEYIIGRRPIIHRSFDRRLQRLDQTMGNPLIDAMNRINEVISLLNRVSAISVSQRNFLLHQIRGTNHPPSTVTASRQRGTSSERRPTAQPSINNWMSREQIHRMLSCLLPLINHRIVTNVGSATGMSPDCDLNRDSFSDISRIHAENQLITTINANYRDSSRTSALNHYVERLQHVISLLNNFVSTTATNEAPDRLATVFIQQQQGRPTQNLDLLINRISSTREILTTRYRNILRIGATIEYARAHDYDPDPVISVAEVRVNNRVDNPSGVVINWNHRDLIPIKHLPNSRRIFSDPIDIMFAVAMTRFLKAIKSELHVVEVYSDGFIRNPLGLDDPHPFGRSCDVTGFGINPIPFATRGANNTPRPYVLHLRCGYPLRNLRGGQHASNANLQDFERGPSDWFNIALLNEGNYREELNSGVIVSPLARSQYLRRIISLMPRFFGFVKGPGSDNNHMDHFHIDLARSSISAPSINCPATMLNPTPFIPMARPRQSTTVHSPARPAPRR